MFSVRIKFDENLKKINRIEFINQKKINKDNILVEIENVFKALETVEKGTFYLEKSELIDIRVFEGFSYKVIENLLRVKPGNVITYKHLAEISGNDRAARAVGNIMSLNPYPLLIPCHRVVKSDGTIGFYQGGSVLKKNLLEKEGVEIINDRIVI